MNAELLDEAFSSISETYENPTQDIYYFAKMDKFLVKDSRGIFVAYKRDYLQYEFSDKGFSKKISRSLIHQIQSDNVVDAYLDIAGHPVGLVRNSENRILVPAEQRRIEPKKGNWPTIKKVLFNMLSKDQYEWFLGWLQVWLQAYYAYSWAPGQVLVLIGEPAAGKSLLQRLLSYIFGGKFVDPTPWVTGQTEFNSELAGCPHLVIEDRFADSTKKIKDSIRERSKSIAVNEYHRIRGLYKEAISINPLWRLTISCNATAESMGVIPPIDESTKNKVSLLWCSKARMPMATNTHIQKKRFMDRLEKEMPALIYYLLKEFKIKDRHQCKERRMGVGAYHHPNALKKAEDSSYYGQKMCIVIDALKAWAPENCFINHEISLPKVQDGTEWTGTPSELLQIICRIPSFRNEFKASNSLGRILQNRVDLKTGEVTKNADRTYTINLHSKF
jgi:hypothetical protein|tara:strand:- start:1267 stop:2604 length:1338 start_codon:yes stop_codon:yes gene_type:complete